MNEKLRHKRVRLAVKKVNKDRKKQAKKIDILCNDLISEHREFIKRLETIGFVANFYKSILGITDPNSLFSAAYKLIECEVKDTNIAFFLRQPDNFELHIFESAQPIAFDKQRLENCFTREIVESICKLNKLCSFDSLLEAGLVCNPVMLNRISAFTIPLGHQGQSLGFILIYRSAQNKLAEAELKRICAVTSGLSRAIQSCLALLQQPQ